MRARRGIAVALCALAMLLFAGATVYHTGGTDSNGGHWNHSTGKYHYHHGYPEHQHTNGSCPYDFDDKSGQDSSGSGGEGGDGKPANKEDQITYANEIRLRNIPETLKVGEKEKIKWLLYPAGPDDSYVSWKSKNSDIATINNDGEITAVSKGTAHFSGRAQGGATSEFSVQIEPRRTVGEWVAVGFSLFLPCGAFRFSLDRRVVWGRCRFYQERKEKAAAKEIAARFRAAFR